MERRYLPALQDHLRRAGAFATKWEGWVNPRNRAIEKAERINISPPERSMFMDIIGGVGCYVLLYKAGPGSVYVAYVGFSANMNKELQKKIDDFRILDGKHAFIRELAEARGITLQEAARWLADVILARAAERERREKDAMNGSSLPKNGGPSVSDIPKGAPEKCGFCCSPMTAIVNHDFTAYSRYPPLMHRFTRSRPRRPRATWRSSMRP